MVRKTILACTLFLGGCITLNNVIYAPPGKDAGEQEINTITVDSNKEIEKSGTKPSAIKRICPEYIPPPLPTAPAVPLDKIPVGAKADDKRLHDLLIAHIEDMHNYARLIREIQNDAYKKYLKNCGK